jgi:aspartate racemase
MPDQNSEKIIGIVGGAGPFAGLDLLAKVLDQTAAVYDKDHLTVIHLSQPNRLPDRTGFLLGETAVNPAHAIFQQLQTLARAGANIAAIPCNTAHAPVIFDQVVALLKAAGCSVKFLHMIAETAVFIQQHYPQMRRIGVLSTTGTYRVKVYPQFLEPAGFEVVVPHEEIQETAVTPAIYDPDYGIKAQGCGTAQSREGLMRAVKDLRQQGAEAVVLGCTEIPLAITEKEVEGMVVIDPTLVLARALIREANPGKLRPFS